MIKDIAKPFTALHLNNILDDFFFEGPKRPKKLFYIPPDLCVNA